MQTHRLSLFVLIITVLTFSFNTSAYAQSNSKEFVIMIDPGHGGKDSGTRGTGRYKTYEKDIALDVSLALGKMIKQKLHNVKVVYTRTKDVFPTLDSRPKLANKKDVDLFVSLHCNAQPGKKGTAYGSETYVLGLHKEAVNLEVVKRENSVIFLEDNYKETYKGYDPNSPESLVVTDIVGEEYLEHSIKLARYIEDEFQVTAKRKSRGVKQAGFWVLAYTYMPSILVELGFLTHKKEEDFLNSKKGKDLMTKSLFNAIDKYLQYLNINTNKIEVAKEEPITINETIDEKEVMIPKNIQFKVQIAASTRVLDTIPDNFKKLKNISRYKEGRLYKYFYGSVNNYNATKQLVEEAKEKGYTSSFVVAFKDGKKIPLDDALKTSAN